MSKLKSVAALAGAALTMAFSGIAAQAAMVTQSDRMFIHSAGTANNDELYLSKLAVKKASDPNVRMFARKMIQDHTMAGAQLKSIAAGLGVPVPAGPDSKHVMLHAELARMSAHAFNMSYMSDMLTDHLKADHIFKSGATVPNADLRSFAVKTLPTIENHLKMAASMKSGMMASL